MIILYVYISSGLCCNYIELDCGVIMWFTVLSLYELLSDVESFELYPHASFPF